MHVIFLEKNSKNTTKELIENIKNRDTYRHSEEWQDIARKLVKDIETQVMTSDALTSRAPTERGRGFVGNVTPSQSRMASVESQKSVLELSNWRKELIGYKSKLLNLTMH